MRKEEVEKKRDECCNSRHLFDFTQVSESEPPLNRISKQILKLSGLALHALREAWKSGILTTIDHRKRIARVSKLFEVVEI